LRHQHARDIPVVAVSAFCSELHAEALASRSLNVFSNPQRRSTSVDCTLGTFEAAAVLMLKIDGVSVAVGLSTALLFRGLTLFLPMAPGYGFLAASTGIALRSMGFSLAQNPNALGTFAGCELFLHLASRRLSSASTNIGMLKSRGVRRPMQACFALDWRSAC
jgi:hypothetical protein